MIDIKTGEPYINVWFGNFYRPAYDGEAFIDWAAEFLKNVGFNSVLLDSKAWEDFRERYDGGEKLFQYPINDSMLLPRTAVCVKNE